MTVTITDSEDQVVFSDTLGIAADIDQISGIELDTEVYGKFEAKASPFRAGMKPTNSIQPSPERFAFWCANETRSVSSTPPMA
ncbi:MAG: hypothetical protein V5A33_05055 [Halobacteriales archaeon]